jgi:hypothetical protein
MLVVFGQGLRADGNVRRATDARRIHTPTPGRRSRCPIRRQANLALGVSCSPSTIVDTTDFAPGGTVTVTVRCEASMADVTLLGVPGRRTFTATATEVIDTYRSGS